MFDYLHTTSRLVPGFFYPFCSVFGMDTSFICLFFMVEFDLSAPASIQPTQTSMAHPPPSPIPTPFIFNIWRKEYIYSVLDFTHPQPMFNPHSPPASQSQATCNPALTNQETTHNHIYNPPTPNTLYFLQAHALSPPFLPNCSLPPHHTQFHLHPVVLYTFSPFYLQTCRQK